MIRLKKPLFCPTCEEAGKEQPGAFLKRTLRTTSVKPDGRYFAKGEFKPSNAEIAYLCSVCDDLVLHAVNGVACAVAHQQIHPSGDGE